MSPSFCPVLTLLLATAGLLAPGNDAEIICSFSVAERFDCLPGPRLATRAQCLKRGCCWQPFTNDDGSPFCYYPSNYPSYNLDELKTNPRGYTGRLSRDNGTRWSRGDFSQLQLDISYDTATRMRLRLTNLAENRWEVPLPLGPPDPQPPTNPAYKIAIRKKPFGIQVTRTADKFVLFDSISIKAPIRYSDQFIQISTRLTVSKAYGLGERYGPFLLNLRQKSGWSKAFWNRDISPEIHTNLYGSHNFFLGLAEDGSAYGIFLLNSNAQEVVGQPLPALTYRTIGGILDFFFFTGPSPTNVVQQYQNLIGRPMMPPYWSLGFHLCKYGVNNVTQLRAIYDRNRNAYIPFDTHWNDIDYMDHYLDWTLDEQRYGQLSAHIDQLHRNQMHSVMIVDPAISNSRPGYYPIYDEGLKAGIFIKNMTGQPLIGKVWPGTTVFPDFAHPNADSWWYRAAQRFHTRVSFDGLWIDMNEPSNFGAGSIVGCPVGNTLDRPPYVPLGIIGMNLMTKTICPSSHHYLSPHYNLHNMYGYYEARATNRALLKIRGANKRVFVLSRSTFAGSGRYTFHWTGDVYSTWQSMQYSIAQIMNFNMFGIPMVGADICGFSGDTVEELCVRWMQLGSFYPFMRNHNDLHNRDQDPAVWSPSALKAMNITLNARYALLPYFYTLFHRASENGTTVARPLFFEFARDPMTHFIDRQFVLGPAVLVSPVLEKGARSVVAYIPDSDWCDMFNSTRLRQRKQWVDLEAPLDRINLHLRGGFILPFLPPARTTKQGRGGPFRLLGCLDTVDGKAKGELYWDDGESIDAVASGRFNQIEFDVAPNQGLRSTPKHIGYRGEAMTLGAIALMGIGRRPDTVTVNGVPARFSFSGGTQLLDIVTMCDFTKPVEVKWN